MVDKQGGDYDGQKLIELFNYDQEYFEKVVKCNYQYQNYCLDCLNAVDSYNFNQVIHSQLFMLANGMAYVNQQAHQIPNAYLWKHTRSIDINESVKV